MTAMLTLILFGLAVLLFVFAIVSLIGGFLFRTPGMRIASFVSSGCAFLIFLLIIVVFYVLPRFFGAAVL